MNTEQLLASFIENYLNPKINEVLRPPQILKRNRDAMEANDSEDSIKMTYNLDELDELVATVQQNQNDLESATSTHGLSIRYLITKYKECILAKEGAPNTTTPGHGQISTSCLAAGNLFLDAETHEILAANHQSGDFKPKINSLVFILKKLMSCPNIQLSPHFYLILVQFNANEEETRIILSEELRASLDAIEEPIVLANDDPGYHTP